MSIQQIQLSIDSGLASKIVQRALEQTFQSQLIQGEVVSTLGVPALGQYWPGEGGINAGLVRGHDGTLDYYLIVAVGTDSEFKAKFGGYEHETEGTGSAWDGLANTRALLDDEEDHPAAKLAVGYTADGHSDFYLPARRELQIAEANAAEVFSKAYHWSSTQHSAYFAYVVDFGGGYLGSHGKGSERLVRPVRRRFI